MAQFNAFAPNVEVNGETVLSVVEGMGAFKDVCRKILAEHGLNNVKPGKWYPQQAGLDAFQAIATQVGLMTLTAIGKAIPESAKWPPQVDTLEKALASIDVACHMNHRGGEIGSYKFESTGPKSGKMVCHNPYPSEFDQGIIVATARKFAPEGTLPKVKLDETAPTRKKGADSCSYLINW